MTAQRHRRREERVTASLPVTLGEQSGMTSNVSANGLFFEMDDACAAGSEIDFSVELEGPVGKMMLRCRGTIVRTEQCGARTGVAVKIEESSMEVIA